MRKKILITLALTIFLMGFISAVTINVDGSCLNTIPGDDPLCDDAVTYLTIQGAINTAANGDTINVAAGTYDEQVVIDGKNLTLQGVGDATIIRPSSEAILTTLYTYPVGVLVGWEGLDLASPVLVKNSANTTIKNLKVDGINFLALPAGAERFSGILYGEAGGLISNVTVNNIKTPGYSIRTYAIDASSVTTPLKIEIKDSRVNDFARTAIQSQGVNMKANIHDNVVVGPGAIGPANVPNGIVLIAGAVGNVTNNTISANHYTAFPTNAGSGVLLYQAGTGILVSDNEIFDVDDAVLLAGTNSSLVKGNNLHDNVKGIRIEQAGINGNNITGNLILDNTLYGIDIDALAGLNNVANRNYIVGNVLGVNNSALFSFDAENNYWGSCDGPGPVGPGSGDSVSTNVDFTPWTGICVTNKVGGSCTQESSNVTLSANVNSLGNLLNTSKVWFSYIINGTNYNKTAVNMSNGTYFIIVNSSQLIGGQSITWTVYANDTNGFVFKDGTETFYVRNSTFLGITPWPWDGLNSSGPGYGWWVTEPTLTLTKDAASSGNNSWYQWDSDDILLYSGSFGLEDIPNPNPISAGTLELNWWTNFGSCGNETVQTQILKIDLIDPIITNLQPTDGSTVFNNLRPTISALLDEVYGSNSGINQSNVSMKLDGILVIPNVTSSGDVDAIVSFVPGFDLSNGSHEVSINVTDIAGRFSEKTWNFEINITSVFGMIIYSPENITYNSKRIPFNISLSNEVEKIEYISYNDRIPRWRVLCRDCDEYGYFGRPKTKSLREGENVIGIRATDSLNQINETNISLFVDSKAPKIQSTEPKKNEVVNGSNFSVKYTEDNLQSVILMWNPNVTLANCTAGINQVCSTSVNLSAFDGQEIEYWFNMTDIANNTDSSKPTKVFVDTTSPILTVNAPIDYIINTTVYGKSVPFNLSVSEEVTLEFIDNSETNPRWKRICSRCDEYGLDRLRTKSFRVGTHDLMIRAKDLAGNIDSEEISFDVA